MVVSAVVQIVFKNCNVETVIVDFDISKRRNLLTELIPRFDSVTTGSENNFYQPINNATIQTYHIQVTTIHRRSVLDASILQQIDFFLTLQHAP